MKKNATNVSKHTEYEVLKSLRNKRGLLINDNSVSNKVKQYQLPAKSIQIDPDYHAASTADTIGNGTKGKLSYLKNYCGYTIIGL